MTVRKKILIGFIGVFIVGMLIGATGLIAIRNMGDMLDRQHTLQAGLSSSGSVLNAHYVWRQSLTETVLSGGEFTGSLNPNTCALGNWLNSGQAEAANDAEINNLLKQTETPHAFIHTEAEKIVLMMEAGDKAGAQDILVNSVLPTAKTVIDNLSAVDSRYNVLLEENNSALISVQNSRSLLIAILMLAAFLLCFLFAWRVVSSIMAPIRRLTAAAEAIAVGDMDITIDYTVNDEIGRLAESFRRLVNNTNEQIKVSEALAKGDLTPQVQLRSEKDTMSIALSNAFANLNDLFGQISGSAGQVASAAKQIANGAQSLASGSTQQAASVQEFMAALSMVGNQVQQNADTAGNALNTTKQVGAKMAESMTSMDNLRQAMHAIEESSVNISRITKVIEDIAFQTNILALNAAVEAARAGQHGKGFAVVAEEVRSLAGKSAEAAKETTALIEGSTSRVREGGVLVGQTNEDLLAVSELASQTLGQIELIANSASEQADTVANLNQSIAQISAVVQSNSATAEQSAAAAQEMSGQSAVLDELISRFKLKNQAAFKQFAQSGTERHPMETNTSYGSFEDGFSSPGMGKY